MPIVVDVDSSASPMDKSSQSDSESEHSSAESEPELESQSEASASASDTESDDHGEDQHQDNPTNHQVVSSDSDSKSPDPVAVTPTRIHGHGPSPPAQLTKKQILNNHIVLMRKSVRQAKVHIIHKLTREIKRLRSRKGQQEKQAKALKKAQRFVEEIQAIRTLKQDEIAISALLNPHSSFEEELKNFPGPTPPPNTRALARLNHHPIIIPEVQKYRESNPHWALQIPVLLEKSKEKQKLTERKEKKKVETKKPKSGKAEAGAPDPESAKKLEKSTVTAAKNAPKVPPKLEKTQGTIKVQILQDLADLEEETPEAETPTFKPKATAAPAVKPKSSFFLGGVDEAKESDSEGSEEFQESVSKSKFDRKSKSNYSNNNQNSNSTSNRDRNPNQQSKPIFRKGKLINPPPKRQNRQGFGPKGPQNQRGTQGKFEKNSGGRGGFKNSNFAPIGVQTKSSAPAPSPATNEKLHPSWEAKKRQSSQSVSISSFQGKKIKFSDD